MDDKPQMTDAELQKLLQDIDAPTPDEAAKISALNMAESQFGEKMQKNAKMRQGNISGRRPMDVIHKTFIFLTGGQDMKKSYAFAATLAIGVAGIALVSLYPQPHELQTQSPPQESVAEQEAAIVGATPLTPTPAPGREMAAQKMMDSAVMGRAANMAVQSRAAPAIGMAYAPTADFAQPTPAYFGGDEFEKISENPLKLTAEEPVSTFSIDVDTASYAVVRRALNHGYLPPKDAVRIEELINYFDYDYPVPDSRDEPFKPTVALYETPWNPDTMLMHVGLKGHALPADTPKPRSNLVFLLDVSGSMNSADKLPLLKQAFRMLLDTLDAEDSIAIVTYAGQAGVVLEPTKASEKATILHAIDTLQAGGSTAGAEGIRTAYELAERAAGKDGINRVILATDGDFNVGITNREQLKDFVERKRESGIYLSVLGFGQGNYNDAIMQALAQNGNGNAAYIDSINEARKVLVDEAASTLYPIANDVKIQVEFNPAAVSEYRLIGYETRLLNREDFNNDKVDAGDIGAGHTVTALYEITPVGSKAKLVDDLRYSHKEAKEKTATTEEYAFLKLRYKLPGEKTSKLLTRPITQADVKPLDALDDDIRFAGAVAAFGQLLRGDSYIKDFTYADVLELASSARGKDTFNYRGEFLTLVRNAEVAQTQQQQPQGQVRHPVKPMTR